MRVGVWLRNCAVWSLLAFEYLALLCLAFLRAVCLEALLHLRALLSVSDILIGGHHVSVQGFSKCDFLGALERLPPLLLRPSHLFGLACAHVPVSFTFENELC